MDYVAFFDGHFENPRAGVHLQQYKQSELLHLIDDALHSFKQQQALIDVRRPLFICGDIHGDFNDLMNMFLLLGQPPAKRYLFLGDLIDRDCMSIECAALLVAYKVLYPEHVYLLRGNHETATTNTHYGFKQECNPRFNKRGARLIFIEFNRST